VRIRPLEASDVPLLREYLPLSIYLRPGAAPLPPDVGEQSDIARYVSGWGRAGDDGLLALADGTGVDVGAAWLRLWTPPDVGYGFVDARTPELGVAVRAAHRGRGIGTALLRTLMVRAAAAHAAISLSVSIDNPAVRLYERLGFATVRRDGASMTMLARLLILIVALLGVPAGAARAEPCRLDPAVDAALRSVALGIVDADNQRDLARVLGYYAADATLLPPNDAPVSGVAAIRPRYEQLFADYAPAIEAHVDEVCGEGSLAFVRGRNRGRLVPHGAGAVRELSDAWLMVVRRGVDGRWRISHLMWHPMPSAGH
jgi:ketosteroid isomerase-like protein/GNAT superfamily N-acetyltransferase